MARGPFSGTQTPARPYSLSLLGGKALQRLHLCLRPTKVRSECLKVGELTPHGALGSLAGSTPRLWLGPEDGPGFLPCSCCDTGPRPGAASARTPSLLQSPGDPVPLALSPASAHRQ